MAQAAFHDVSFMLRRSHNEQVAKILSDPEASDNDKYVALTMLRNAEIAAKGQLPVCQDTGTAIIHGEKGQQVWTGYCDEEELARGVYENYTTENLRYSQNAPLTMYEEVNTKCNLPAQIDLEATEGMEYKFLCVAKGGGSANKTYLYQETKAVLTPTTLVPFLIEKMKTLGTAACPPYHIAFVIGGTSAEKNLLTVKLASTHYYDELPTTGNEYGRAFRDVELEKEVLEAAHNIGLGAQFGGKYFAHDVRIVRLPRHGASCPIGMGVSCSADRNIKCKINKDGIWIEKMDSNPGELIPAELREAGEGDAVKIDLNRPMPEILKELSKYPVATRLSLNGTIIVGRDIAHAKLKELLDKGEELPQYIKDHPIYYAGPAKTPEGMACGSMGPTTAGRMDPYVDLFQSHGGSMIMLAKGNRSQQVTDACQKHGGFYLGSIGGPAAILAQNNIKHIECVAYPELGMEAIWKIEVENFPAFILVDDKGNDFFKQIKPRCTQCPMK
jgi:fumarate hydratase class I